MDLVEYQGKQLFARLGVPVPAGGHVCRTVDEVEAAARDLGGTVVVKAQVRTGGRGKAGGVKLAASSEEAREVGESILGLDINGHDVRIVYVEPATDIADEYYLSVLHDRVARGYLIICSAQGGVDIEEVNRSDPEAVVKQPVLPSEAAAGLPREIALDVVARARIPEPVRDATADLLVQLFAALRTADALLMEINPLVRTTDDQVLALDAKVTLDGNARFRHEEYAEFEAAEIEAVDPQEARAKQAGIQYVKLDGDIGVLGNGAGLVMATLDVVAEAGGRAADFLDVGGGASAETMAESLSLVLSDERVRSVLVNIFGGITRCDEIANGVLGALQQLGDIDQKLVVRLDGTNADAGRAILAGARHPSVISVATMEEAAESSVELAKSGH